MKNPGTDVIIQLYFKFIQLKASGCYIFPLICLSFSNETNAITLLISAVTVTFYGTEYCMNSWLQLNASLCLSRLPPVKGTEIGPGSLYLS